jgi:cytochrome c peroxidase
MANPVEMAHSLDGVVKRLQADPKYLALFQKAWGTDKINIDLVAKSIASFERTVIAGDSPFDRFYYGHDKKALSPAEQRGLKIFTDPKKANCEVCHVIGKTSALFTDNKFHNLCIGADTRGNLNDVGRYSETKNNEDMGAFKTPTLRNLAHRAPFMHDGSFPR